MKILYVYSDDDFGALRFENEPSYFNNLKDLFKEAISKVDNIIETEIDGIRVFIEAFEFGPVDIEFVNFMIDRFVDYDSSKNSNFYIIKD